jgi:hypothetical protein
MAAQKLTALSPELLPLRAARQHSSTYRRRSEFISRFPWQIDQHYIGILPQPIEYDLLAAWGHIEGPCEAAIEIRELAIFFGSQIQ